MGQQIWQCNEKIDRSETDIAPQVASHEVATACSLGRQPEVAVALLSVPFFPSSIAAASGDEGRKKRELVVRCVEPHANAWGYMLSLLRSWISG